MIPTCAMPAKPVLIDLETRSNCDLKIRGGWNYADDPTTRLLTVAWTDDLGESFHVWLPGVETLPDAWRKLHLDEYTVHTGDVIPVPLMQVSNRPWVAHNAASFDKLVWAACADDDCQPPVWIDSMSLALSVGLPGGLNRIGKMLWGEGKYEDGKNALKTAMTCLGLADCEPENVPIGQQCLIARYCVQDVKLLADLWARLVREYRQPESELRVLKAHESCNARGVRVHRGLVDALIALDQSCKDYAVGEIRKLSDGKLDGMGHLQSRATVFKWLEHMGIDLGKSLAKDVINRWIDRHKPEDAEGEYDDGSWDQEEEDQKAEQRRRTDLAKVVKVLQYRATALRVTGGKLAAALGCLGADDHARGLFVYHGAHTGRWAGRRIQPHNFPRPKPGVSEWNLLRLFQSTGKLDFDAVSAICDPSDAASALLRTMFIPEEDEVFMAADLAQIEARMLAWLAGEKWLLDLYFADGDPYIKMAERICGPKENWPVQLDKNGKPVPPKKHNYRQLVGKVPILACGYQGGPNALANYCANMGFNIEDFGLTAEECVLAFRRAHPAIAGEEGEYDGRVCFRNGFWGQLNTAAVRTVEGNGYHYVGDVKFHMEPPHLICTLPSGRRITYRNARIHQEERWGRKVGVVFYLNPRYGMKPTYGGMYAENITQAAARDPIADALVKLDRGVIMPRLHVHDEVGASGREEQFPRFMELVTTCPDWLTGFPLDAEGSCSSHYTKVAQVEEHVYRNGRRHK